MTLYQPMLAVPWPEPFDDDGWWFEVKWDGFRVLAELEEDRMRLRSRRGNDLTATFPELAGLRSEVPAVVDGEVVAFDDDGRPSFQRLQRRAGLSGNRAATRARGNPVTLVVFDLLHHAEPLVDLPLEERWDLLAALDLPGVARSDPHRGEGTSLYRAVVDRGLEGVVAKRAGSRYHPGRRSPDWRKIAHRRTARVVIGGYLPGEGARRSTLGSVLVGLWEDGRLRYCGAVGSGFDEATLASLRDALDELRRGEPPFADASAVPSGAVWAEPRLVGVVEHAGWTDEGRLRAPVWKGFTLDPPEAVTLEAEGP